MILKLPKWVRVVIAVPMEEFGRTKHLLKEADAAGAKVMWSVTKNCQPRRFAENRKKEITEQSGGDVRVIVFIGMDAKRNPAAWSVVASAPVGKLKRFYKKYPQYGDFVPLVQEIMHECLIKILEPYAPRPEVVLM